MAILKTNVQPGASKNKIDGICLDMLKLKVISHQKKVRQIDPAWSYLPKNLEYQK